MVITVIIIIIRSAANPICQFDISEIHAHVGIKCKTHETYTKERNEAR